MRQQPVWLFRGLALAAFALPALAVILAVILAQMDVAVAGLLVLAVSGAVLWWSVRRGTRRP